MRWIKKINFLSVLLVLFIVSCKPYIRPESDFKNASKQEKFTYWLTIYNYKYKHIQSNDDKEYLKNIYSLLTIYQDVVLNERKLTPEQLVVLHKNDLTFVDLIDNFDETIAHKIFKLIEKLYGYKCFNSWRKVGSLQSNQ